jgi:hypothetical protein
MIKLTYKSKNRNKTTEKQALLSVRAKTETLVETVTPLRSAALTAHRKYQWQELKHQLLRSHTAW